MDDSKVLQMLGVEVAGLKDRIEALEQAEPQAGSGVDASEVAELRRAVSELAGGLAALAEEIAEDAGARPLRAPWWPGLAGAERQEAWHDLTVWVEEVFRQRHPEDYSKLGRCWYRHPDVVDDLGALRVAWHAAYRAKSPLPSAAVEWHDRWYPGVLGRITKALGSCKGGHVDAATRQIIDADDLAKFIAIDVTHHSAPPPVGSM